MLTNAIHAIYTSNYKFFKKFLESSDRQAISKKLRNGSTLLHIAASSGRGEAVKLLLEYGVDVDVLDRDGNTAMHKAAQLGHKNVVVILEEEGKSRAIGDTLTNIFGDTVMHLATQALCLGLVEFIASRGFSGMRQLNAAGFAPVHCAARGAVVENLVAFAKIDVSLLEFQDVYGLTPLHHAVLCDSRPMIQGILDVSDKSVIALDKFSRMPVHIAAVHGNLEAFTAICDHDARMLCVVSVQDFMTPLHLAASYGHLNTVKHIVQQEPAALYHRDVLGRTPLHLAVIQGHAEVCSYVLSVCPAIVHEQDSNGWTPYHVALHMKLPYILGLVVIASFN